MNFKYFGDAKRENDPDLDAVLDGAHCARSINHRLSALGVIKEEAVPGGACTSDDQLRTYVRDQAW